VKAPRLGWPQTMRKVRITFNTSVAQGGITTPQLFNNVKKTYLLVINNDKKRREQEPAPLLTINGETLRAMNLNDACRYLGHWGTGNGCMRAAKEVVRQKIIAARDLIKYHPLTPGKKHVAPTGAVRSTKRFCNSIALELCSQSRRGS